MGSIRIFLAISSVLIGRDEVGNYRVIMVRLAASSLGLVPIDLRLRLISDGLVRLLSSANVI